MTPGMELLKGAVDCHVHACPHINERSVDVLQATREAAAAGMRGLGLMDNFANSSGFAALVRRELAHLQVDVFGGLIMEPPAGGVNAEAVKVALSYGYGPADGARFISLPTHHTRNIARLERRSPQYVAGCLEVPERGDLPEPLPEILDLIAAHDVVLNAGHISGSEAVRLVEVARDRGVARILVPASHMSADEVREITAAGAFAEFSFFFISHAVQIGLTHVDAQKNVAPGVSLVKMHELIQTATPARTVLSGDCGVYVLPPPVEGLREFLLLIASTGYDADAIRVMVDENPGRLFKVAEG